MISKIVFPSEESIALAAASLLDGRLIGLPTETVYGLAARGDDPTAVESIFFAKGRPRHNPLILHVADPEDALAIFADDLHPVLHRRLVRLIPLWPGPLTVIGPRRNDVLDCVTAGGDTVAVRIPDHPVALAVLRTMKSIAKRPIPLAAPSANVSNYISPTTAAHVQAGLGGSVAAIIDGGPCRVGLESTILFLGTSDTPPRILRRGHFDLDELRDRLGEHVESIAGEEPIRAPGQFAKHYSPRTEMVLIDNEASPNDSPEVLRIGFDAVDETGNQWTFATDGSLATAAANLYGRLRQADETGFRRIEVVTCAETGIGMAIMDRLRRAQNSEV